MLTQWPIQDAKNQFSKVVDIALKGTPQVVTRRGVPVVVMVAADQYALLTKKGQTKNGFASFLLSMPTGTDAPDVCGTGRDCGRTALELRDVEF